VPVVAFFWDDPPDEWLSRLRAAGSHIWFQVGSVDEAKAALRRGAQGLVVQGSEAGGHNRAEAGTFSLLPGVIDAVPSVPAIASGGISRPDEFCPVAFRAKHPTANFACYHFASCRTHTSKRQETQARSAVVN
jgi:imidazole glycerol phosphate synthase subunit HisF